jgi:hypothetical protein
MKRLNLSMIGNLTATLMLGVAVWMGMQWSPNPNVNWMSMESIAFAFCGGLLTALSSQFAITVQRDDRFCQTCGQERKDVTDGNQGE